MDGHGLILGWPQSTHDGPRLGRETIDQLHSQRNSIYKAVTFDREGHCLTIAPTGAGKGRDVIIPNLLSYSGSIIVVDPKGENYDVTARYRARELGQKIVLLDPFEQIQTLKFGMTRGGLDPFDFISEDENKAQEEAQMIAEILSGGVATHREPFWDQSAKGLLAGLIHNIATSKTLPVRLATHKGLPVRRRNIRHLMRQAYEESNWYFSGERAGLIPQDEADRRYGIFRQPYISNFARQQFESITSLNITTRGSILAFVTSYLHALTAESVQKALSHTSISVDEIVADDRGGFTIYIVIPPSKLESHSSLLRLWISMIMTAIMRRGGKVNRRTLFLLDECAQLGTLAQLRSAVTLLRGYGLQVWMFFQDLSQLSRLYSDWANLANNCAIIQTFGHTRELPTSELVRLFKGFDAKELQSLARSEQMLSVGGRTLRCERANFLKDKIFDGRHDANPRYTPSSASSSSSNSSG